jgi:hypothetical protein
VASQRLAKDGPSGYQVSNDDMNKNRIKKSSLEKNTKKTKCNGSVA